MRKHAQSWLIKAIIVIIAVVFVLYFGTTRDKDPDNKAAVVNGQPITVNDYENAYYRLIDSFQREYRDIWNDDLLKTLNLKKMALDNLINQTLIMQEAEKLGFDVTKEEIQKTVSAHPAFQTDGRFDMTRYKALMNQKHMRPEDFEQSLSQDMILNKTRQFFSSFSAVTDQEILDRYTYDNEKVKISYAAFDPKHFKGSVTLDETGLKDFFELNKDNYRMPEKIKIAYIEFDPKNYEKEIEISEEDIKNYYEFNQDAYTEPRKAHARHILFKLDENATDAQAEAVMQKALPVLKKAREGGNFADLAKQYSEGPTKTKGGDLGYFTSGQMVKAFDEMVFKMKPGEISDLVRTPFGYHIIRLEDLKEAGTKTLEQVRDSIKQTLIKNTSVDLAYEKGQMLIDQMPYDVPLSQYAPEQNMETKTTDFLARDDRIPGMSMDKSQLQPLFAFEINEISDLLEIQGKYYILQMAERKTSYIPEMTRVEEKVKADYSAKLAADAAKTAAENCLADLKTGFAWDDLSNKYKIKTEQSDFFNRQGTIPLLGYVADLKESAFRLNQTTPFSDHIFDTDKGFLVIKWEAYEGIDPSAYEKEKENLRSSMLKEKQARTFETWIETLNKKAEIERFRNP